MGSGAGRKTKAKHTTAASVKSAPSEAPPWANRGLVVVMVAGVAAAVAYTRMINPTNTQDPRNPVPVGAPSPEEGIRYLDPVPHTVRSINITVPSYTHQEGWGVHRVELLAVDDFLPLALAERWRDSLAEAWDVSDREFAEEKRAGWVFTTNNNGSGASAGGGNAKIRGNHAIPARKKVANRINKANQFAYRKWELPAGHPTLRDVHRHMESQATRDQVARILHLGPDTKLHEKAIEIFVTQYSKGDFLSSHNDAIGNDRLPTFAFVISLTAGPTWTKGFGGELEFLTAREGEPAQWGNAFAPKFNRAMFFRTSNPPGPSHRVTTVTQRATEAKWLRFGFTGWYTEAIPGRSEDELKAIVRKNLGVDLLYTTDSEREEWENDPGVQ